jgi:hypothetical protein
MDPYTERYILQESERGLYGDVHFYDYKHNGLHVENYPNARFVSGNQLFGSHVHVYPHLKELWCLLKTTLIDDC